MNETYLIRKGQDNNIISQYLNALSSFYQQPLCHLRLIICLITLY